MSPLTVRELLVYLDSVQRHFGGDIACYVVATGPSGHPTPAPLREATTQHGPDGWICLVLTGEQDTPPRAA
jgi:hypothetical protein